MFDKRLMEICPESKKYIAGNVVLQWLELLLNTLMIYCFSEIVETLRSHQTAMENIFILITIILCTVAARFFTTRLAIRMNYLASRTVKKTLRGMIYDKLLKLGKSYRDKVSTAELVQESIEGVEQLENYFGLYVPQFFYALLAPATLFLIFGIKGSWQTGTVLLLCVPLIPGAIIMVQKLAKKLLRNYWEQYAQLGSSFLENLQGMTTLKIYQADSFKNEQMNKESEHFRKVTMAVLTMQLNSIIIMDFIAYGGAALGIILAINTFMNNTLAVSDCLFVLLLSADFFLPMRRLGSYFHVAMNGMAASDKIFRLLSTEDPKNEIETVETTEIKLKNVSFSYDAAKEVLHNVSMTIPEHNFIGIVGESGSGKSTIASLITGKNRIKPGEILIGGKHLEKISEESLSNAITYIGFGSMFFKGSVRENLEIAMSEADDNTMWYVLETCQLTDFLKEHDGLDTQLLENASNLSGGQRQRLALARAILHDSPVYIFDEATSNIDMESEEIILEQIKRLAEKKTVIMITHRLANVTETDRIYCMEQGKIVESGNHKSLLSAHGIYAKLWRTQYELEHYGLEEM